MSHNPSYFEAPSIPREPAPALCGPTIETYMDRPSVRKKRVRPQSAGRQCPVESKDGKHKWESVTAASRALQVPFGALHYAIKMGHPVNGMEIVYSHTVGGV